MGLINVSIPVQFQITNVLDWAYNNADPTNLLQDLATREVVRYLAGVDLNDLLSRIAAGGGAGIARTDPGRRERTPARRENHLCRLAGHSSAGQRSPAITKKSSARSRSGSPE